MKQTILVIGGTGTQGGATIDALLSRGDDWDVRALVRNADSPKARALAERGVQLVTGDLNDADSVARAMAGAWGVHSVQTPLEGGPGAEERQGKLVAAAAKTAGVRHFVYSSVAGAERHSGIPHFESKWRVEQHIASLELPATVLRPVLFMDNFATLGFRTVMLAMLRTFVPEQQPTQMVAAADIGQLAAKAFADPDRYIGQAIELAGDSVTRQQLVSALRRHGRRPAITLKVPGWLQGRVPKEYKLMMAWIANEGFKADLPRLQAHHPELMRIEDWAPSR